MNFNPAALVPVCEVLGVPNSYESCQDNVRKALACSRNAEAHRLDECIGDHQDRNRQLRSMVLIPFCSTF